jgi:hypothetical protein
MRVLLAVFLTLFISFQAPAAASEPWILWNESTWILTTQALASRSTWKIVKSLDDKDSCELWVAGILADWDEMPKDETTASGGKVTRSVSSDRVSILVTQGEPSRGGTALARAERYLCLPHTVDPRK